jgi:hypothetical protein
VELPHRPQRASQERRPNSTLSFYSSSDISRFSHAHENCIKSDRDKSLNLISLIPQFLSRLAFFVHFLPIMYCYPLAASLLSLQLFLRHETLSGTDYYSLPFCAFYSLQQLVNFNLNFFARFTFHVSTLSIRTEQ